MRFVCNQDIVSFEPYHFRVKLGEIVVDVAMREMLTTFIKGGETVGLKINQFAYIFRAKPSSTNPLPWIHVYVTGEKITCSLR